MNLKQRWRQLPRSIRRPLVGVSGGFLIILAGLTGWLPGPGGIPLFLLGIAILASEFTWAERLRDYILSYISLLGSYIKRHPFFSGLLFCLGIVIVCGVFYLIYTR